MATNLFRSGNLATDDPSQIKSMYGYTSIGNKYSGFREAGLSSQYKVPSGKVFHVTTINAPESGGGSTAAMSLVGNLTDWGGFNITPAPPGTPIPWVGELTYSHGYGAYGQHDITGGMTRLPPFLVNVRFTENVWPGLFSVAGNITTWWLEGIELDA